jgi:dethiobiotin synthetase
MRPRRLVVVVGTGTDVGKTWVAARLLRGLRTAGATVAARKPAQSFDPADPPEERDAAVLASASRETAEVVCPPEHWYEVALAPPMAADALGRPPFTVGDLVAGLGWPDDAAGVGPDVGLVETAGGLRSPMAADGDCADLVGALAPDLVVVVADAGLGTINAVRLTVGALPAAVGGSVVIVLNRFDPGDGVHERNRAWLADTDGLRVMVTPGEEERLVSLVLAGARTVR